ncbi:MiaB/RimO family radical SAM methylthiotransferase [Candidatus Gracilibacteria bacterium]|nr:MiaB/RimO family radical SAM methylthiotransferase [Candidatus Gracilibacteria bacterium]
MRKYFIMTFGCAMNQADSEKVNMILLQSGFMRSATIEQADLVIFNTCSVRQKGEDKVFGMIEEIKKINAENKKVGKAHEIKIGITGCMVRRTGLGEKYLTDYKRDRNKSKKINLLKDSSEIFNNDDKLFPRTKGFLDFTLRIEDIKFLPLMLTQIYGESIGNDYKFDDYLKSKQLRENPSSATIIIQTGCDNYCTFCIVPYTRGSENSRPIEEIVQEAKEAVKAGAKEITLVGQNVNSYGKQFVDKKHWNEEKSKWNDGLGKSPFRQLLEELDKIEGLDRIRFTSSNPHDMTQDILDAHFDLKSTCNYLHFALQSGNNKVLKKMNRRHKYEDFKKIVDYLRSRDPKFSISTDIIVGFSGETDEMFADTVKAFDECEFDFAYNARYSVRTGTIASKMFPDDITDRQKAERWHILNNKLLESILKRNQKMLGTVEDVLVSGQKDEFFFGRTRNFKEVYFTVPEGKEVKIGDLSKVKLTELDRYVIKGSLVE